jgi:transposase
MYGCVLSQDGDICLHRHMQAAPDPFLTAVAPYRDGRVVAVECLFPWYWLADLGAEAGMACVLGQARSMNALHGGQAKNDQIDAQQSAMLLRGGMLPNASVSPADRRAPRDLLRRRPHLRRNRSALLSPGQHTNAPYHLPEIGTQSASQANREGVAARFADAAGQQTIAVDLALIPYDAAWRKDLALSSLKTAQPHHAHPLSRLHTVPGIGQMLRLVLLSDMHRLDRLPSVQDCASSCRLVPCRKEAGGTRVGTAGKKIGHAPRQWAVSAAAPVCLRTHPPGQQLLARWEQKHATGHAWPLLAHMLARAVSCLRQRTTAVEPALFLRSSGSRAGEPGVSLDPTGRSLERACWPFFFTASLHAKARLGRVSLRLPRCLDPRSGS